MFDAMLVMTANIRMLDCYSVHFYHRIHSYDYFGRLSEHFYTASFLALVG